jgi:hypothetical protein
MPNAAARLFVGGSRRSLPGGTILEQGPTIRIMPRIRIVSVHRCSSPFAIRQTASRPRGCRAGEWNLGSHGTLNMRNSAQAEGCA